MRPMIAAQTLLTKPLGAVIATRPASNPFPVIEASGFPYRIHMYRIAPKEPVAAGQHRIHGNRTDAQGAVPRSRQRTTRIESEPTEREDEAAGQNDDNVVPGIALGVPLRLYFPIRGPMIMESASAVMPPTECTTPEPAKSQ